MTIAEVAKEFDLTPDTLRYYERIGLIPPVPRTGGGIRDYDESSRNWIEFIKCMRSAGLSIETLVSYVTMFQQGDSTHERRRALLVKEREQLILRIAELQETLQRLTYKIDNYDTLLKGSLEDFNHR